MRHLLLPPPRNVELNDKELQKDGRYVLYWMQQSQRAGFNPALEHAIREGERLYKSVVVGFGLMTDYTDASAPIRLHAAGSGGGRGVAQRPRRQIRHARRRVAHEAPCRVVQVEGDVVVPVETASDKQEYAARTLRPKIQRQRDDFLQDLSEQDPSKSSLRLRVKGDLDSSDAGKLLNKLELDRNVSPVTRFQWGRQPRWSG